MSLLFLHSFATISVPRPRERESMATTLHCLSTLHLLPRTHHPKTLNSLKPITKSQPCKIPEIPSTPNAIQLLKSSSLPLAVIALPFFLDPQVIKKFQSFPNSLTFYKYNQMIENGEKFHQSRFLFFAIFKRMQQQLEENLGYWKEDHLR